MPYALLYVTFGSRADALALARTLTEERLVACANIIGGVTSVYRWDGETKEESESIMIAKTEESLVTQAIERVVELHPYDCPCAVSLPMTGGHTPFLNWISDEVSAVTPSPLR